MILPNQKNRLNWYLMIYAPVIRIVGICICFLSVVSLIRYWNDFQSDEFTSQLLQGLFGLLIALITLLVKPVKVRSGAVQNQSITIEGNPVISLRWLDIGKIERVWFYAPKTFAVVSKKDNQLYLVHIDENEFTFFDSLFRTGESERIINKMKSELGI